MTTLIKKTLIFLLIAPQLAVPAIAEVAIIVHPSNTSVITKEEVQRIFLGKKTTFDNGNAATPYNLAHESIRAEFDKGMLDKSSSELRAYWSKLVFTGKGTPPAELPTTADVISKVGTDPTAIGYVDSAAVADTVKVILKL